MQDQRLARVRPVEQADGQASPPATAATPPRIVLPSLASPGPGLGTIARAVRTDALPGRPHILGLSLRDRVEHVARGAGIRNVFMRRMNSGRLRLPARAGNRSGDQATALATNSVVKVFDRSI
jgi:hypothetical protein